MPLLYFIWKDAGHSWRYGCLCTQFIHRFYRGPFGHLTRERTARRNGLEKAVMLFFHRPSPTKHVILSDSNTERRLHAHYLPHSFQAPFFRIFGLDAYVLIISVYGRFAQPIKILHIVQHSHQENCTICDFQAERNIVHLLAIFGRMMRTFAGTALAGYTL